MTIFSPSTIPYFYIIRHISSKKLYAGCRYAKGCNPSELLTRGGYYTSSNTIRKIIEIEGLEAFEIIRIDTYCDGLHPHDYETLFLEINNVSKSSIWYNIHENSSSAFNSATFKKNMLNKYGVDNYGRLPQAKKKSSETVIETNKRIWKVYNLWT